MRKLIGVSPLVFLVVTACGSRGTHDDEDPIIVNPPPACEGDDDCGDGAICFEGTCTLLAETEAPDTTPPAPTTSSTTTSLPDPDDVPASNLSGVWVGYLEGGQFASGSDVVRVEISTEDCTPTATITLGEGDPLPPVSDPTVGYPESVDYSIDTPYRWFEGHAYTASEIQLDTLRVQMLIRTGEVWTEWCELQPSIESDGRYSCVENAPWSWDVSNNCALLLEDGGEVPHDCGHLALCTYGTCSCSESGCVVAEGNAAELDVALDDGHLEGTFTGFGPVRLYRED